jgi:hypothetical protein
MAFYRTYVRTWGMLQWPQGDLSVPKARANRKEKKTFSLSSESLHYLESVRKQRKSGSLSSVLDDLIREQQQAAEMKRISASITRYYDALTDEEVAEDRAWGKFSESQFSDE